MTSGALAPPPPAFPRAAAPGGPPPGGPGGPDPSAPLLGRRRSGHTHGFPNSRLSNSAFWERTATPAGSPFPPALPPSGGGGEQRRRGARGRASARVSGRRRRRRARARIPAKRPEPAGLRHPPAPPPSLPEQSNSWRTGAASSEPWRAAAAAARRREPPRRPRGSLAPAEQGKVPAGGWGPPARAPRGPAGTPVVDFAAILRAALGKAA